MRVEFNSASYDVVIIDNEILLQGLHNDVEFKGLYKILKDEAEEWFFASATGGETLIGFISRYIDDTIQNAVLFHKELAVVVKYDLN